MLSILTSMISALAVGAFARTEPVTIDFQLSSFLNLYFSARTGTADSLPKRVLDTGAAISADGRGLVSGAAVDSRAVTANSPENFRELCGSLPETIQQGGKDVLAKKLALSFADALCSLTPSQLEGFTKNSTGTLTKVKSELESTFFRHPNLILDVMVRLGMGAQPLNIKVVLVQNAPLPGAITYRTQRDGTICVVSTSKISGSDLVETVLHEAIHALDVGQPGKLNHLASLRAALERAGTSKTREAAEALHALVFAQAAYSVNKVFDKKHQPYGVRSGAYARMSSAGSNAIMAWNAFLEGKVTIDDTLKSIVQGTVKKEPSSP